MGRKSPEQLYMQQWTNGVINALQHWIEAGTISNEHLCRAMRFSVDSVHVGIYVKRWNGDCKVDKPITSTIDCKNKKQNYQNTSSSHGWKYACAHRATTLLLPRYSPPRGYKLDQLSSRPCQQFKIWYNIIVSYLRYMTIDESKYTNTNYKWGSRRILTHRFWLRSCNVSL